MGLGVLGGGKRRRGSLSGRSNGPYPINPVTGRQTYTGPAVFALGASTIPGTCWDVPGFKDCHAQQWQKANTDCQKDASLYFNGDMSACIDAYADQGAYTTCVPKYCPKSTSVVKPADVGLTWRNTTPNPKVTALQKAINAILVKNGYDQIGVDGKLGAGTCGGAMFVDQNFDGSFYQDYGLAKICQSATVPTKNGKPATNVLAVPMTTHIAKDGKVVQVVQEEADVPWGVQHPDTAALQSELNVHLAANDMPLIPVNGVLDGVTCGAMKWLKEHTGLDYVSTRGKNCKSFTAPSSKPLVATGPAPVPIVPTGPVPTITPAPAKASASSMGLLAAGLAIVAVAGGFAAKKAGLF